MPSNELSRATQRLIVAQTRLTARILTNEPREKLEEAAIEVAAASSDLGYLENQIRAAVQI